MQNTCQLHVALKSVITVFDLVKIALFHETRIFDKIS